MCASDDDESCSALHDQDLSDAEWQIVEVSVCFAGRSLELTTVGYICFFEQESLPIFQRLAELSKLMEGDNYVLSSTYWDALFDVEEMIAPHAEDSAPIAALRQAMHDDHFNKRVTLEQSLSNVLHVLMTLLDPRYAPIATHSLFLSSFMLCL